MDKISKFYQVGKSHYKLDQIVKITSSFDWTSVLVNFSDGSEVEFTFNTETEHDDFIRTIRSVNF